MNNYQKSYYHKMAQRGRLIPIRTNGELRGILTFFIGNGKPEKYTNREMWTVVDDEPNGDTIYCDHLITNKDKLNRYIAISVWHNIKIYLKKMFPNIKKIRWNKRGGSKNVYRSIFK